jgi:hypothetical protein
MPLRLGRQKRNGSKNSLNGWKVEMAKPMMLMKKQLLAARHVLILCIHE